MYKVLIIDDEPLITKGLSEKIDWSSLECEICGIALNGYEGKNLIDELKPDIIISDIVMSGCTGLELANYVHQYYQESIMILLSGHNEFTFAKEALKYSVFDYLLKPTIKEEVMNVIKKAVMNIKQSREKKMNYENMESAFQESILLIEQSLLYEITVKGAKNTETIKNNIEGYQLTFGKGAVITIEVCMENNKNISFNSINKSIEKLLNNINVSFRFVINNNQIIILPSFPTAISNRSLQTKLIELGKIIKSYLYSENAVCISIGIGGIYSSINNLHDSYIQSNNALLQSYFVGKGEIHYFNDINRQPSERGNSTRLERLIFHFEEWDLEKILEEYAALFKELKCSYDKQFVLNQCMELLIKIGLIVTKWDKNYRLFTSYEQLEKYKYIDELQDFLKQEIIKVKNHLFENMNKNNIGIVDQAKRIVEQQYDNSNLSAQYIADMLDINVSYLSRTFKKETGENLINFVTEKRMQIAQKLLKTTDLKTNEVAKKVGFIDARYFGQVFKKFVSKTPSEYKKCK